MDVDVGSDDLLSRLIEHRHDNRFTRPWVDLRRLRVELETGRNLRVRDHPVGVTGLVAGGYGLAGRWGVVGHQRDPSNAGCRPVVLDRATRSYFVVLIRGAAAAMGPNRFPTGFRHGVERSDAHGGSDSLQRRYSPASGRRMEPETASVGRVSHLDRLCRADRGV